MIDNTGSISDVEVIAILGAAGAAIKKYWPEIKIALSTISKVLSKLLINSSVVDHVKKQGTETALAKLQTPNDIFCVLSSFELSSDGRIVLKDQGRVNTLLNLERPLTESEMEEIIRAVRSILVPGKE